MLENIPSNVFSPQLKVAISEGMKELYQGDKQLQNSEEATQKNIKKQEVQEAVEGLNNFLQPINTAIRFEYHEQLHEYFVKVIDSKTDETIREIPPKKLLDFYAAMTEFVGLMVDKKI